jgi:dopamine beta-monooxygenase
MRALAVLSILWCPGVTWALPNIARSIPNSENPNLGENGRSCIVCHVDPRGDGEFNDFGEDVDRNRNWPWLSQRDSDRDGQTNGFELGDPDGLWRPGDTPSRSEQLSLPGDPSSVSDWVPPPPVDMGPADAGMDIGPPDSGSGPTDGGVDGGVDEDAGASDDTGARDLGAVADGGVADPDAGVAPSDDQGNGSGGGCSGGHPEGRTPGAGLTFLSAVVVLLLGRRWFRRSRT